MMTIDEVRAKRNEFWKPSGHRVDYDALERHAREIIADETWYDKGTARARARVAAALVGVERHRTRAEIESGSRSPASRARNRLLMRVEFYWGWRANHAWSVSEP